MRHDYFVSDLRTDWFYPHTSSGCKQSKETAITTDDTLS